MYADEQKTVAELRKELERSEAARRLAEEANNAQREFLAQISHEIRTPMNAVVGVAHILGASSPLTERQRECVETLKTSANGLMALIDDMLDIAKIESRSLELEHIPFNPVQLVKETVKMMELKAAEKNIEITTNAEASLPTLFIGDPTRVRQVILNLGSNALKFTERGTIHFGVAANAVAANDKHALSITVRDTGIGIAQEKLTSVFEKFTQADTTITRKYGGTGLGLAITKMLVEAMGGDISVASELGKGSAFTVRLPLQVAA